MTLLSRFRGCLLGGAVGDALGAPVEFLTLAQLHERYGPHGIRDMDEAYGRVGAITDDTQMTLFTAEGLLRAHLRAMTKGIEGAAVRLVRDAYLRWLHTQGVPLRRAARERLLSEGRGWLLDQKALFSQRAPGNTCIGALLHAGEDELAARNTSKGCGGVMRVAPVALYAATAWRNHPDADAAAFRLAMEVGGITHGHLTSHLSCGVLAVLLAGVLRGDSINTALGTAMNLLRGHETGGETERAVEQARELATAGVEAPEAIPKLGQGWIAEEALAIAIYCALMADDFETGIVMAVNIEGDSDSTGSITGEILGAALGEEAIPERWLRELELREVVTAMAEDFLQLAQAPYPELAESWLARYPPF